MNAAAPVQCDASPTCSARTSGRHWVAPRSTRTSHWKQHWQSPFHICSFARQSRQFTPVVGTTNITTMIQKQLIFRVATFQPASNSPTFPVNSSYIYTAVQTARNIIYTNRNKKSSINSTVYWVLDGHGSHTHLNILSQLLYTVFHKKTTR